MYGVCNPWLNDWVRTVFGLAAKRTVSESKRCAESRCGKKRGSKVVKTDDAVATHTTVTSIANITAFAPAVVKRQGTPGTQLKFPTALGVVDGPAVPWIVTSYSDQSDAYHDAGLTGPTFASRDQGRHWQPVDSSFSPWITMGVFTSNADGGAVAFSYLLRHADAAAGNGNSTVLAHIHATRLTTSADGVTQGPNVTWQPVNFNLSVEFPHDRRPYTPLNVSESFGMVTSGGITKLKSGGLLMLVNGAFADGCKAGGCTSLVALKSNGTGGAKWEYLATVAGWDSSSSDFIPAGTPALCQSPSESGTTYLADGSLLTVFRSTGGPLCSTFSRNGSDGEAWSVPLVMNGCRSLSRTDPCFKAGTCPQCPGSAGASPYWLEGVRPQLVTLDGLVVMSTGRPSLYLYVTVDDSLAHTDDPLSGTWQRVNLAYLHTTLVNDTSLRYGPCHGDASDVIHGVSGGVNGTSGYTGLLALSFSEVSKTNEVLVTYDRLGNGWDVLEPGQVSAEMAMRVSFVRNKNDDQDYQGGPNSLAALQAQVGAMEAAISRLAVALMVSIGLLTAVLLRLAVGGVKQSKEGDGPTAIHGVVCVTQFGAKFDGHTDDSAAIQQALDSGASTVILPAGIALVSTAITVPQFVSLTGQGISQDDDPRGTTLLHSGTGECVRCVGKVNSIPFVNSEIASFRIRKTKQPSARAAVALISGCGFNVHDIRIDCDGSCDGTAHFTYGIVIDQCEVMSIARIDVQGSTIQGVVVAGVFCTNGPAYTPDGTITDCTNAISVYDCNVNMADYGILHDGGEGFKLIGGNMNGCHIASMRLAGLLSFSIDCVYMEGSQGEADILIAQTASNGLSVGTGNGGTISNCRLASGTASCIHFENWSIQTSGYLIHGNLFDHARLGSAISTVMPDGLRLSTIGTNANMGGPTKRYLDASIYEHNDVQVNGTAGSQLIGSQLEPMMSTITPGGRHSTFGSGCVQGITHVTRLTGPTYVVLDTDHCVFLTNNANAGSLTLTLPAGPEHAGRVLSFTQVAGTFPCVIGTSGLTLEKVGDSATIVYDCQREQAAGWDAAWRVLSRVGGEGA